MPRLSGYTVIESQNAYDVATTTGGFMKLGQIATTSDGRKFRWVKVGASSALVAGNVIQSPAINASYDTQSVQAAVAIGATVIPITVGAATTAHQFDGGSLTIGSGTGIGQTFTIASHDVVTSGTCNFTVEEPVIVALDTTSRATTRVNQYNGVIQAPSTLTGVPVGVANRVLAVSTYGWLQVSGPCATLSNDTGAVGVAVMVGGAAGATITQTAGNPIIGTRMAVGIASSTTPVFLTLA